jgi:cytochrome c-type protein NapC
MLLLLALVVLPVAVSALAMRRGLVRSSETSFCLGCHEMEDHGRSLFVDNPRALPAVHYQKRLIARDATCYACHTDYAMFGDVKAKANGLRHVWAHYVTGLPDELELYQPYPNYNCLHCHDDARSYLEASAHQGLFAALESNERSCLSCHDAGHALDDVRAGKFWVAEPR